MLIIQVSANYCFSDNGRQERDDRSERKCIFLFFLLKDHGSEAKDTWMFCYFLLSFFLKGFFGELHTGVLSLL